MTVRLRMSDYGWQKWNGFTEAWENLSYRLAIMSKREIGEFFAGCSIQWEAYAAGRGRA